MARYMQDAGINQPLDVVSDAMEEYLRRNRYTRTEWKDELVYMSANGEAKGNRYLIWSYMSGILHIEAWLKGSFGNEVGLTGIGSKKRAYKESIDNLIEVLRQPVKDEYTRSETVYHQAQPMQSYTQSSPSAQSYAPPQVSKPAPPYVPPQVSRPAQPYVPPQASKPAQPYASPQSSRPTPPYTSPAQKNAPSYTAQPKEKPYTPPTAQKPNAPGNFKPAQPNTFEPHVPDYREEKSQKAMRGFTFGMVAIFTSFVIPIMGFVFAVIGLGLCNDGMDSDMADKARIGKILCIVALVWCGLRILYYIFVLIIGVIAIY